MRRGCRDRVCGQRRLTAAGRDMQNRFFMHASRRRAIVRLCAVILVVLAASPFTFPFGTCDLFHAQHENATSATSGKVKPHDDSFSVSAAPAGWSPAADLCLFGPGLFTPSGPTRHSSPPFVLRI